MISSFQLGVTTPKSAGNWRQEIIRASTDDCYRQRSADQRRGWPFCNKSFQKFIVLDHWHRTNHARQRDNVSEVKGYSSIYVLRTSPSRLGYLSNARCAARSAALSQPPMAKINYKRRVSSRNKNHLSFYCRLSSPSPSCRQ